MISKDLLTILCCPKTKQSVSPADADLVEKINQKIQRGGLKTQGGKEINETIEDGLVRADKQCLYPIRKNIPIMLVGEAIPLLNI